MKFRIIFQIIQIRNLTDDLRIFQIPDQRSQSGLQQETVRTVQSNRTGCETISSVESSCHLPGSSGFELNGTSFLLKDKFIHPPAILLEFVKSSYTQTLSGEYIVGVNIIAINIFDRLYHDPGRTERMKEHSAMWY